jgi:sec-independent protein translocase protein TatB
MFDFSMGEIVVIGAVALIAIGPKELPGVLRAVGQYTTKIRRMASEFQSQFQEALREAEMSDLKKEVDTLNDTAKGFTSQFDDPLNLKEATKWEPKTDGANKTDDPNKADAAANPDDAPPPESATVTPDGYAAPEPIAGTAEVAPAAPEPPASEHHVASMVNEEDFPPPVASPAQPSLPEGSGQGGVHS